MSEDRKVRLGYIGLGSMGAPMAERLSDWPGGLTVCDVRDAATAPFADAGAAVADSAAEVAERADVISVTVLDDALRFYFEFHEQHGYGYMAHIHDFFASAAAIGDAEYDAVTTTVEVVADEGPAHATTIADPRNLWGRRPSARLVTENDPEQGISRLRASVVDLVRRLEAEDAG